MNNICNKCNKNIATFHYTQNINGKETSVHLCEDCLKNSSEYRNIFDFFNEPFYSENRLFSNNFTFKPISENRKRIMTATKTDVCPLCKTDLETIIKNKRLGCSHCFEHFKSKIDMSELFSKKQEEKPAGELEALKSELNEAIKKEDYSLAASLRDKIRTLEKNEA